MMVKDYPFRPKPGTKPLVLHNNLKHDDECVNFSCPKCPKPLPIIYVEMIPYLAHLIIHISCIVYYTICRTKIY